MKYHSKMNYILIALLSIIWPGLGHLYTREIKKSLFFIFLALSVHIIFYQFLCFNYFLFIVSFIVFGSIQIFAIIDSIKGYRKNKNTYKIIFGIILIIISIMTLKFIYLDNITKFYRYRPLIVPSSNMANTLLRKDRIIGDFSKKYKNNIKRGDIIIYTNENKDIIFFRCIAIGNDIISIKNDNVYLNNILLEEEYKYLDKTLFNENMNYDLSEIIIQENKVFLLGDNRYNSRDSRFMGQISINNIIGKVLFLYLRE